MAAGTSRLSVIFLSELLQWLATGRRRLGAMPSRGSSLASRDLKTTAFQERRTATDDGAAPQGATDARGVHVPALLRAACCGGLSPPHGSDKIRARCFPRADEATRGSSSPRSPASWLTSTTLPMRRPHGFHRSRLPSSWDSRRACSSPHWARVRHRSLRKAGQRPRPEPTDADRRKRQQANVGERASGLIPPRRTSDTPR
jgi:hypothetical protein